MSSSEIVTHCPKCKAKSFHKRGFAHTKSGKKQRYYCKKCRCQFSQSYKGRYSNKIRLQAITLSKMKMSFRQIGEFLGVSREIVRLWVLRAGKAIQEEFKELQVKEYDIVEIDELCTYIKKNEKMGEDILLYGLLITENQGRCLITKLETEE